jgi:aminoglycoside/choline kinase family phosphotransferase
VDAEEKRLIAAYNAAANELKALPRGDPRHFRASAKLVAAQRALKKYRHDHGNGA